MITELDDEFLDWYNERPQVIKQAINIHPPDKLYVIKATGHQCYIYSYDEPISGLLEEVTITVNKTGISSRKGTTLGEMVMPGYKTAQVFGLKLDDIEPWVDIEIYE